MAISLCFNEFTFSPVIRDSQPWFKSSELPARLVTRMKILFGASMNVMPMNSPKI